MKSIIYRIAVLLSAIGVCGYALSYLNLDVKGLLALKGEILNSPWYLASFYTHVVAGSIALSTGALQFFPVLRKGSAKWHRNLGIAYTVGALVSGSSGLIISLFATGGWISISGFFTFSVFWFLSTLHGYKLIKKQKITEHRNWMLRSYAAAFAAVTLRIWLLTFPLFGLSFIPAYQLASWMTWIINLSIAELIIWYQTYAKQKTLAPA